MIGPYVVGEQPTEPLVFTVRDADGTALDLTQYSDFVEEGDLLPSGSWSLGNEQGELRYRFSAPFQNPGAFVFRVRMNTGHSADYTPQLRFVVERILGNALITPSRGYELTNVAMSNEDLLNAQRLVSLLAEVDLTNPTIINAIGAGDLDELHIAIAWQAEKDLRDARSGPRIRDGIVGITTGDNALQFGAPTDALKDRASAHTLAAIARLSWRQPRSQLRASSVWGPAGRPATPPDSYTWTTDTWGR